MPLVKSPTLRIQKSIEALWTDDIRQKLISFWSERRFRFEDTSVVPLVARRGRILWNLISYDSTRLSAELSISSQQSSGIDLVLTVNTAFQQITEWNRAFWDLEMATCESFVLHGDRREAEWDEFMRGYWRAAIIWTLTLSLGGRRIPQKKKAKANA